MRWVCCLVGYLNTIFLFRLRHLESFDQIELDTFARLFRIRKGLLNIRIRNHVGHMKRAYLCNITSVPTTYCHSARISSLMEIRRLSPFEQVPVLG